MKLFHIFFTYYQFIVTSEKRPHLNRFLGLRAFSWDLAVLKNVVYCINDTSLNNVEIIMYILYKTCCSFMFYAFFD